MKFFFAWMLLIAGLLCFVTLPKPTTRESTLCQQEDAQKARFEQDRVKHFQIYPGDR